MARVSKRWVKEYVSNLYGFGGQVTLENLDEYPVPEGGYDTTLTRKGIEAVESGDYHKKFQILLHGGLGWADCYAMVNLWVQEGDDNA